MLIVNVEMTFAGSLTINSNISLILTKYSYL